MSVTPRPLGDRVLVKVMEEPGDSVWLPNGTRARPQRGIVVAVGQGYMRGDGEWLPLAVHPGDVVVFYEDDALRFRLGVGDDGEWLSVLPEKQIIVVLDDAPVPVRRPNG